MQSHSPFHVRLSDFGLSYQLSSPAASKGYLSSGIGPTRWLAPEALDRRGKTGGVVVARPSDMYMVGGLIYEVLTGGDAPFHWVHGDDLVYYRGCMQGGSTLEAAGTSQ